MNVDAVDKTTTWIVDHKAEPQRKPYYVFLNLFTYLRMKPLRLFRQRKIYSYMLPLRFFAI